MATHYTPLHKLTVSVKPCYKMLQQHLQLPVKQLSNHRDRRQQNPFFSLRLAGNFQCRPNWPKQQKATCLGWDSRCAIAQLAATTITTISYPNLTYL